MTTISDLHSRWSKDANYQAAYDALREEFDLARAQIEARTAADPSQSVTDSDRSGLSSASGDPLVRGVDEV